MKYSRRMVAYNQRESLLPREGDLLPNELTRKRLVTCLSRFAQVVEFLETTLNTPTSHDLNLGIDLFDLKDEFGRLRVWVGNIGGFRRGHGSLEYRLQEAPLVYTNIHKILVDLDEDLQASKYQNRLSD